MKILQINNYHYIRGGSERVYFETSKILENKGHEVLFFSVKDKESESHYSDKYFVEPFEYENVGFLKKIKLAAKFIYNKEAKENLEILIKNEKPDIAHLHMFFGHLSSSILPVLKQYNIPVVMTVHEHRMLCPISVMRNSKGEICEKCANGNYINCIIGKCHRDNIFGSSVYAMECFVRDNFFSYEKNVDRFIMPSKFIMNKHIQYKPSIKTKSRQIYNFIDLKKYALESLHNNYYLYFGRLSREKGIMTLLSAWRHFPNLRLYIVGDGELEEDVKKYIKRYEMNNIELLGFLNGDTLLNIIKKSKFIFVPSECYENNPMTVIEGFALGKPSMGAKIGGIPELVKDGVTGYLFESGSVNDLIKTIGKTENISDEEYKKLSKNARNFAEENFNENKYYTKLLKIYKELKQEKN